jgi:hypothetical protein
MLPIHLFRPGEGAARGLKILIVATPKTGNVWLKNLLAVAYGLPQLDFPVEMNEEALRALGGCWVAHQHLQASVEMLRLLAKFEVVVITLLRHPGDVLVSLRHFVPHSSTTPIFDRTADEMLKDGESYGERSHHYVKHHFAVQLNLSLLWMRLGAIPVRYEDLRADTVGALRRLTDTILPVDARRLRAAAVLSDFDRMQRREVGRAHHFRRGLSGEWITALPASVVEIFRTREPYPAQFAALGYSLDKKASMPDEPFESVRLDPFQGATHFDNGVALCDLVLELYMIHCFEAERRWPQPLATGGLDSFFGWLMAPSEADPFFGQSNVLITNLAHEIYRMRPDVQQVYPEPYGRQRLEFVQWLLIHGRCEYHLDSAFIAPVLNNIAEGLHLIGPHLSFEPAVGGMKPEGAVATAPFAA